VPENFDIYDEEHRPGDEVHRIEVATQHFVGKGRGGFEWEREQASEDVVRALWGATRAAYVRLSEELDIDPWEAEEE